MASYLDPLVGRLCTRVTVDVYAPPLVLWFLYEGPTARVEISGPFDVSINGNLSLLDPAADPGQLAPDLQLVGREVTAATVTEGGDLRLDFSEGATVDVRGDPTSEPWWFDVEEDAHEG